MDWVVGHKRSDFVSALFGTVVFAEIPLSITSPAGTRWIPAMFLGPQYGTRSSLVSSLVGSPDSLEVKIFVAKSIRCLNRIVYEPKYGPDFVIRLNDVPKPRAEEDLKRPAEVLPPAMPKTGPPVDWLRQHGKTPGCYACDNPSGKAHGRVHNRKCKDRYLDWLRSIQDRQKQAQPSIPHQPPVDLSVPPIPEPSIVPPDFGGSDDIEYEPSEPPSEMETSEPMEIDRESVAGDSMDVTSFLDPLIARQGFVEGVEIEEEELTIPELIMQSVCSLDCALSASCEDHGQSEQILSPLYLPKTGNPTEYSEFELSGKKVYLAKPTNVVSEDSGRILDIKKPESGRLVELESLNHVKFGSIVTKSEAEKYAKTHGIKILGTRWIVNPKEIEKEEGVRRRLVVQEIASGSSSAASQGISSSTPSGESLRIMLTLAASEGYHLTMLDISTAFMHSPLPKGHKAVVRMPGDVSWKSTIHEPVYAILNNSLNGLRVASLAWLELARRTLRTVGLRSSPTETTIFSGQVEVEGKLWHTCVLIYVDDILVISKHSKVHEVLVGAFKKVVRKVKITGNVSASEGGTLTFLGKQVMRKPGSPTIYLRVGPEYLKELCEPLTASETPPDILKDLEKKDNSEQDKELSEQEASKYRSILGRVAWWIQSRPDLSRFGSLLAQGQKTPQVKHMSCLMKFLKFVKSQLHLYQSFPSSDFKNFIQLDPKKYDPQALMIFTDASWGSQNSTQRRSCSGYCFLWRSCLLKGVSRLQTSISLSSCESEAVALVQASKEGCGMRTLVEFIRGTRDITEIGKITFGPT